MRVCYPRLILGRYQGPKTKVMRRARYYYTGPWDAVPRHWYTAAMIAMWYKVEEVERQVIQYSEVVQCVVHRYTSSWLLVQRPRHTERVKRTAERSMHPPYVLQKGPIQPGIHQTRCCISVYPTQSTSTCISLNTHPYNL